MQPTLRFVISFALLFAGCGHSPPPPVAVETSSTPVRYVEEVQPILESRCVVCHSCYNSPCQLKLSSFEGLERGGTDLRVYNTTRLHSQDPTRLFTDAQSTEGWRERGFHSVVESTAETGFNNSIMLELLHAGMERPELRGEFTAESDDLVCASSGSELGQYLDDNPEGGMPFGFPALSRAEYDTIASWLEQGMPGPSAAEQLAMTSPTESTSPQVARWENFLNRPDGKHVMTARYLYEHYFLAHLSFSDVAPPEFYELVRSTTPPGAPIEVIPTLRPYDSPGEEVFYYRFRRIHSTIVHKTHIVVELDDGRFDRIVALFIDTPWLETPHRMGYGSHRDANPFVVYAQIPPRVRYRFLLDHAEYTMRTFIRGPVCRGQVALNVIHDHFWVMFLDPDADETLNHPEFLVSQSDNLRLPTEVGSDVRLVRLFSNAYRERDAEYYRAKAALYASQSLSGFDLNAIWRGERAEDTPVLTVYRHFDSASVHRGVRGGMPRTLWVIDYAQFERIYYGLVAGFDVFGNMSHQLNIRRYMDYLRLEGELNFLQFLPRQDRLPTLREWYQGDHVFNAVEDPHLIMRRGTRVRFESDDTRRELIERIVDDHLLESTEINFDTINYSRADEPPVQMPSHYETHEDILDGFRALTAPGTGFIRHASEHGINVLYLRVRNYEGSDRAVTIVINRWHDNVNSVFGEDDRLDPAKDTIDFLSGLFGSYPNYFFDIDAEELPEFFEMMQNFDFTDVYRAKFHHFGINRADPRFREAYDWFQQRLDQQDPVQTGVLDLSRYYATALPAD